LADIPVKPNQIAELLSLIDDGTLSGSMAKTVFEEMFETGRSAGEIAEATGMVQVSDADAVSQAVEEAVSGNPKPVADYLGGKESAMRYLVGQVMKITRGKANPKVVADLLEDKLASLR
jgi:aspartyl-tRNA(Asn)/glutamyl-tRNA(Gln) amidotransferase subunit B